MNPYRFRIAGFVGDICIRTFNVAAETWSPIVAGFVGGIMAHRFMGFVVRTIDSFRAFVGLVVRTIWWASFAGSRAFTARPLGIIKI